MKDLILTPEQCMKAVKASIERLQIAEAQQKANGGEEHVDHTLLQDLEPVEAEHMRVVFHIPIKGIHFNLAGSAFGGALASVMDIATGHAIATVSRPGFWPAPHGISRVINISFLKPVTRTGEVRIEAKVMQFGKSAAMVRGELTSLDGKEIYCTVEHHKLSFPPPGEVRLPWDDELDQIIADKSRMLVKL